MNAGLWSLCLDMVKLPIPNNLVSDLTHAGHIRVNEYVLPQLDTWLQKHYQARISIHNSILIEFNDPARATEFVLKHG